MSLFSSPSPPTVPFKLRRKSSSASTSTSIDTHMHSFGDTAPCSSSSPSLRIRAPLRFTGRKGCAEWKADDYIDDTDGVVYDQQDNFEHAIYPWSRHTRQPLSIHHPLPSLMTKFAVHAHRSDAPASPLSHTPPITYLYPQGDSAIADDYEYDLESMDIHIRETYFATSAERGRWLSSPIVSRVRSQAIPPMRGHSSPVRTLADASPLRERSRRHKISRSVNEQIFTSSSEDRDEDLRCSSPLPPSSPLTSPVSNHSFLSDERGGDSIVDPHSNS
ncbi:hypothetical protein L210DRAFT_3052874 [Boletus edulis BED1]|uniref:Uncharacterized protein n=1 Tax=Boletus edulis BED1 TaxID=1328754 RepID=A0AAD4C0R4_BOLED|nr:hypothetical protein L210DRAFT_3052874 [Boletus edulis BED1]